MAVQSEFSDKELRFSVAMLVYQRVIPSNCERNAHRAGKPLGFLSQHLEIMALFSNDFDTLTSDLLEVDCGLNLFSLVV